MDEIYVEKQCYKLFKRLGINPAYKGYRYLMTAVVHCIVTEDNGIRKRTGEIYNVIDERYGCGYYNAERNIRFVCHKLFETAGNERKALLNDIFGQAEKVTNGNFIAGLCEYLKYEQAERKEKRYA